MDRVIRKKMKGKEKVSAPENSVKQEIPKSQIKIHNIKQIKDELFFLEKEIERALPILNRICDSLSGIDDIHYMDYWLVRLQDRIELCRQELEKYVIWHKAMLGAL